MEMGDSLTSILTSRFRRSLTAARETELDFSQLRMSASRDSLTIEPFKFLSGSCEKIRISQNYTLVEAIEPTFNTVYFARSLTHGKRFSVSIGKVLNERTSDFSFIVGFTTCGPGSILSNVCHLTDQCTPTGCGGYSEQVKVFKANRVKSKVTFERQKNGEIYFAIDSAMPIRIQFERKASNSLVSYKGLTPYIQLSGNVLSLTAETDGIRKLNIESAKAVRGGQPLGTATAFGPPVHKPCIKSQIFVASSDVDDTKFIELRYPENDVKVTVNRKAILRKNEKGERFFFYLNKIIDSSSARLTVQVTKIYNADKYTGGFEFGLTTSNPDEIKRSEGEFLVENIRRSSQRLKINRNVKVNDKFTFNRTGNGAIEVRKNGVIENVFKMDSSYRRRQNLLPFLILNGTVSGIIITDNETSNRVMEFDQMYEFPPVEFKTTANISLTNQTLFTWTDNGRHGVILNAKPFDTVLKFIIREVRTSSTSNSMTFGLINSAGIGFRSLREVSTGLDFKNENLIQSPALGLKFSLYKTPYGKVTLKYDDGHSEGKTLFTVDPTQCYYPVVILNGTVAAIELLPNPTKKTVNLKYVSNASTSRPQESSASTTDCKICMDRVINSVFIPCGHRFACYDCGKEWMQNGNVTYGSNVSCPVCRKKIDNLIQTFD